MYRVLRYVGLMLVVVGAVLLIVPTASFSTIAGERPFDVSVADDGEAFVAVADTGASVTHPRNDVAAAELVNNLGSSMTVEYEASVDAASLSVARPSGTVTIERGGTAPISVACSPPEGGSGTATLRIDVVEARAGTTTVRDATLETSVEYDCPGRPGGGPSGPPGDAVAYVDGNGNGAYEPNERIVDRDELAEFDDDGARLVIADGGRLDFRNREVDIQARTVAVGGTTLASNRGIALAASDEITLRDAELDATSGAIEVEADSVATTDSTVSSNREIALRAVSGPLTLEGSTVDSINGPIKLVGTSVAAPRATFRTSGGISITGDSGAIALTGTTIDATNGMIEVVGESVDASGAHLSTHTGITIAAANGTLGLRNAVVDSTNGEVHLRGGAVDAAGADISTNTDISLAASGDVTLDAARVASTNGETTVAFDRTPAALGVEGATIEDRDSTLAYRPANVTVTGTPAAGSVRSV